MVNRACGRVTIIFGAALLLSGCEEGAEPFAFLKKNPDAATSADGEQTTLARGRTVEQDVEAPEVFAVTDEGLWDGRPSLGGVWVAHPTVTDPERVIVRNPANGKSIVGALFRRERDNPGPKLQVSSDAAQELGLLAGQPTSLSVIALRREEVPVTAPLSDFAEGSGQPGGAETIEEQTLDPIASTAAAAIDAADAESGNAPPPRPVAADIALAPPINAAQPDAATGLDKAYVQIGIFSVEANANRAAEQLRAAGVIPTVKREESQGKTFWRVIVGPALTAADRTAVVGKVKGLGYQDAYAVSR